MTRFSKQADDEALTIRNLERDRDELRGKVFTTQFTCFTGTKVQILTAELRSKVAGSIPLDKADQWAQALRELAEQANKKRRPAASCRACVAYVRTLNSHLLH